MGLELLLGELDEGMPGDDELLELELLEGRLGLELELELELDEEGIDGALADELLWLVDSQALSARPIAPATSNLVNSLDRMVML